jgi:hypothetical protein
MLLSSREGVYIENMSTLELIKEAKSLPKTEREKILLSLLEPDDRKPSKRKKAAQVAQVKWPDVEERAKRIFGNRVLPNIVLLEREEEFS